MNRSGVLELDFTKTGKDASHISIHGRSSDKYADGEFGYDAEPYAPLQISDVNVQ